jgi:Trk-type K+ transport system membrane component
MIENLTAIGYSLVVFAIFVAIGLTVVTNLAGTQCLAPFGSYNSTTGYCQNGTVVDSPTNYTQPASVKAMFTTSGYLGTSSGGIVNWLPAIIALVIGVMFIGALMGRGKKY